MARKRKNGHTRTMKVLVTIASKHGATEEVGKVIAEDLENAGLEVDLEKPEEVYSLDGYGAVIIGSAVYLTKWMDNATDFCRRFASELRRTPLWAFSVGLSGVPQDKVQDPSRVGPVLLNIEPKEYVTFPGKLDPTELSLRERTVARMGGAVEGDFRDDQMVRDWAQKIIKEIKA